MGVERYLFDLWNYVHAFLLQREPFESYGGRPLVISPLLAWCISTTRFLVLVNGTLSGFFQSSRGLRQGDPLSLFLFVLAMEVLHGLLGRAREGGYLSGVRVGGRGIGGGCVPSLICKWHLGLLWGFPRANDSSKMVAYLVGGFIKVHNQLG